MCSKHSVKGSAGQVFVSTIIVSVAAAVCLIHCYLSPVNPDEGIYDENDGASCLMESK